MAILSSVQALEIIQAPRHRSEIEEAVQHELRIRMHAQPVLGRGAFTSAHWSFLRWVESFLDKDKYNTFEKLFLCPLPTTEIAEVIFGEYGRMFQARDKFIDQSFANDEIKKGFQAYLDEIGFHDFWSVDSLETLKTGFNSYIIIDLPSAQATPKPRPYFYILPIESVHDVCAKPDGGVEYIAFGQDVTMADGATGVTAKMIVMDDTTVRTFVKTKQATSWTMQAEAVHSLNYTPAHKFFPKPMDRCNVTNSRSPVTTVIGDLDRYLFWAISIEHYQLYGAFPIYWGYKQRCGYIDEETKNECDGNGWIYYTEVPEGATLPVDKKKSCPRCSAKKALGAGSFVEVDPPQMKEDADLRDPVGMLPVDVDALNYLKQKQERDKAQIIYDCTGKAGESILAKEAVNQTQVYSNFETRKTILVGLARAIEKSMWFTYDALARMMYGTYYRTTTVNLGQEFFLQTVEELNKDYTDTKTAGRPLFELEAKRDFLYQTMNQNNPTEMARLNILKHLEPYPDFSPKELKDLGISPTDEDFIIKINFNTFVRRFERENLPIQQFGEFLTFDKKISSITEIFKKYADEKRQEVDPGEQAPGGPDFGGRAPFGPRPPHQEGEPTPA